MENILNTIPYIVGAVVLLILIGSAIVITNQRTVNVIERFGKFNSMRKSGLSFRIPIVDSIVGTLNLKVQKLDTVVETKTIDNVFVKLIISVQYFVKPGSEYDAYYKLDDINLQIQSFIFDVTRAKVPELSLDELFVKKDEIATAIKTQLVGTLNDFGYDIYDTLVTDIEPDQNVKSAMNEINAAQRLRVAANEKGEADKILKVKAAEGESESKKLQGEGIANQRKAILAGFKNSVEDITGSFENVNPEDVMNLVVMTQYFDTISEVLKSDSNTTVLLPFNPGSINDIKSEIMTAMITSGKVLEK